MGFTSLIGDHDHCLQQQGGGGCGGGGGTATMPPQLAGNTVSRRLKLLCNDTGSLFPTSTYSTDTRRLNRWKSHYGSDFLEIMNKNGWKRTPIMMPVDKLILEELPPNIFNTWRVPERVTESCPSVRSKMSASSIMRETQSSSQLPRINSRENYVPKTSRCEKRKPVEPDYIHKKCNSARDPVKHNLSQNVANPRLVSPQMVIPRQSRQAKIHQMMRYYTDRQPVNTQLTSLVSSLKKATDAERLLIEKALRLGREGGSQTYRAGDEDATSGEVGIRAFNDWFNNASNAERNDAMNYICSLSGNRDPASQPQFRARTTACHQLAEKRRAAQTWHHLPVQKNKAVVNPRAILSQPQKVQSRHYVIHPDWG